MASAAPWRSRIVGHAEVAPSTLVPNPENWRSHPQAQRDALGGALEDVGWVTEVIVNQTTGQLVDGHLRLDLALSRNEPFVPVTYVELTQEEERLVLATLDPLAAMADAEVIPLQELLAQLDPNNAALRDMLDNLGKQYDTKRPGLVDPDEVPELGEETNIKRGDTFALGDHRLMCGDATSAHDVARLMNGARANLCLTDPPYGADTEYATYHDSQDGLTRLIAGFLPIARDISDIVALTSGINNVWLYPRADWLLCWFYAAGTGRTPWGFSAWQPVLVWGKDPKLANGEGAHPDGFSWPMTRADAEERKDIAHICPKPVSSWSKWMDRLSNAKSRTVYDPFVGSGTTIIAAEQLGRRCYAMEIDPRYVAVAIKRWETFTGREAVQQA